MLVRVRISCFLAEVINFLFLIKDFTSNGLLPEFIDIIYIVSIFLGIFTIISKNPIVSVLFLIGLFVNISVLLISIGFTFIGLSYILVYVGAVSILFLFILMLINIRISELLNETNNDVPLAILTVILFYNIIAQVLPVNLAEKNFSSNFTSFLNGSLNEKSLNNNNFTEEIVYTSSKS